VSIGTPNKAQPISDNFCSFRLQCNLELDTFKISSEANDDRNKLRLSTALIEENFILKHRDQLEVRCTLRLPDDRRPTWLVIVAHGFRGFKDWGFFPYLCQRLSQSGFAALSFNHALCGVRENPYEITDLLAFSKNSTTQELKDWDLVLDSFLAGNLPYSQRIRLRAIGIVGHSRGGSYGILLSSRVRQIQTVVAWGAIETFQRFSDETQRRWRQDGFIEVGNANSENQLRLSLRALDALERNYDRLDVLRAMRESNIPILLLNGRQDQTVGLGEARKLWECADRHLGRFHIIENAGHTFRTQHPFTGPSQPLMEAVSHTISWLERELCGLASCPA
jgi:pimeloyl-ACP methyl ester carboxylesterase